MLSLTGVVRADDEYTALSAFDSGARAAIDPVCKDAREAAAHIDTTDGDLTPAELHAAYSLFDSCRGVPRKNIEVTNYLRVLAASALMLAAQNEPSSDRKTDLDKAARELTMIEAPLESMLQDAGGPADRNRPQFDQRRTGKPHPAADNISIYSDIAHALLGQIRTLQKQAKG
jgi:hypothetical protein